MKFQISSVVHWSAQETQIGVVSSVND